MLTKTKWKITKPTADELGGTCLRGGFNLPYSKVVEKLGHPNYDYRKSNELTDNKVSVEWEFKFSDETVATVYNYKDGLNYDSNEGVEVEQLTDWHIGGHNKKAVERVMELI